MKSYFIIGSSNCFPEQNITLHFEKYNEAVKTLNSRIDDLLVKFSARKRVKQNGNIVEVILKHTKITFQILKYVHEAPISMYVR